MVRAARCIDADHTAIPAAAFAALAPRMRALARGEGEYKHVYAYKRTGYFQMIRTEAGTRKLRQFGVVRDPVVGAFLMAATYALPTLAAARPEALKEWFDALLASDGREWEGQALSPLECWPELPPRGD